jgi:arsenate reductase-like glutaredoxin family protein
MRYYGNSVCTGCKTTRMMLDKYGLPYEYIDVSTIPGFEGEIPQLELDNGQFLVGTQPIMNWIRRKTNEIY